MNERDVTLSKDGLLNYFHFDKPKVVSGSIDLTSSQVQSVRFTYGGVRSSPKGTPANQRPAPDSDDEIRIYMQNRESFIFRASKLHAADSNPCIEKWEKAIRKFTKNVRTDL